MAAKAQGSAFASSRTWYHYDSVLYVQIATHGYTLFKCAAQPGAWCGNAGWFPGFPAVLALLVDLGAPAIAAGAVISWLFALATLILLWKCFLSRTDSPVRYVALAFAAFDPGGIYMRAVFPMSMTVFFLLVCLLMLERRHWLWAGLAGGAAAFDYATAVAIAAVIAIWALAAPGPELLPRRVLRAIGSAGLAVAGLLAALGVFWAETGRWNSYFMIQAKYQHGIHFPWTQLWPAIESAFRAAPTGVAGIKAAEAVVVTAICLSLLIAVAIRTARGFADRWEHLLMLFVLVFWLFPLTQANVSYWRTDTMLLPAALLIVRMRGWLAASLTAGVVAMLPFLAYFFFANQLI